MSFKLMLIAFVVGIILMTSVNGQSFDSRNVSMSEWNCFEGLLLVFPDGTVVNCGTEVLLNVSQPNFPTVIFSPANSGAFYTVIIVDRDAISAANPSLSPIRHAAYGGIPGSVLAAGFSSASFNTPGVVTISSFAGPQPPAGSGCHRYYVMLYVQQSAASPPAFPTNSSVLNWDFPTWASQNKLTKVGGNHYQTQDLNSRTSACATSPKFDTRNISSSEWSCFNGPQITFSDNTVVNCGTEVLQNVSASGFPTVKYPSAASNGYYTLIMVDRDAISADSPYLSPIRHGAFGNIPASILTTTGFNSASFNAPGVVMLSSYFPPGPPAGTKCHRYHVMLYAQPNATSPAKFTSLTLTWDFPTWASQNQLTKVASNYFSTQNLAARTTPCPSSAAFGLPIPFFLTLLCLIFSTFIVSSFN